MVCTDCPLEVIEGQLSSHIICTYGKMTDEKIELKLRAKAFTHELANHHETTLLRYNTST